MAEIIHFIITSVWPAIVTYEQYIMPVTILPLWRPFHCFLREYVSFVAANGNKPEFHLLLNSHCPIHRKGQCSFQLLIIIHMFYLAIHFILQSAQYKTNLSISLSCRNCYCSPQSVYSRQEFFVTASFQFQLENVVIPTFKLHFFVFLSIYMQCVLWNRKWRNELPGLLTCLYL